MYRASCTVYYFDVCTMHLVPFIILMCVSCILYHLLFWCMYHASCTVYYFDVSCILYHFLFWCMYHASCTIYYFDVWTWDKTQERYVVRCLLNVSGTLTLEWHCAAASRFTGQFLAVIILMHISVTWDASSLNFGLVISYSDFFHCLRYSPHSVLGYALQ